MIFPVENPDSLKFISVALRILRNAITSSRGLVLSPAVDPQCYINAKDGKNNQECLFCNSLLHYSVFCISQIPNSPPFIISSLSLEIEVDWCVTEGKAFVLRRG